LINTRGPSVVQLRAVAKSSNSNLQGASMRYHRATEVTKPEADFIIANGTSARTDVVVVSRGGKFYDVRALSRYELDAFVADLVRAENAALDAQTALPC
jgi:hypothetical protein